jgi:hypothetical protein
MLRLLFWKSLGITAAIALGISLLWATGLTARLNLTKASAVAAGPRPPAVCNATALADCIQAAEDDAASCPADCADVPLHARAACLAACRNLLTREKARCNAEFGVCRAGTGCCNGQCTSLGTTQNCGACGNACSDGQTCQGGSCACPAGLTNCNGTCVDLTSDPGHCGACGTTCQVSQFCQSGSCIPFIPNDAQVKPNVNDDCVVSSQTFASWFESGAPSLNGVVKPADSLNFPDNRHFPNNLNCDFYTWSKQMFLWLTSPAPSIYGGGRHIFDSPTFYDVLPLDANNQRALEKHTPGIIRGFALRAAKPGPDGLPVIMDKKHRMFEVQPSKLGPGGNLIILNGQDKEVEIGRITVQNRKVTFLDKVGKPIPNARPLPARRPQLLRPTTQIRRTTIVQKFLLNGRPIFVDPFGNVIDTEEGQAGVPNVLMAQNRSLVYYAIMVNDVYAYFLTGQKNGGITPTPTQFPVQQLDLDKVTAFAATRNVTFPDANALAVEIKTAWVDAATLPNPSDYVTMPATVPIYMPPDDPNNPADLWQPQPGAQKNVTLALVSMHIVGSSGSTNLQNSNHGHPEMIWASFEHFSDTPNAPFSYCSTSGASCLTPPGLKTVNPSAGGKWLFSSSGTPASPNKTHMHVDSSGNIVADTDPNTGLSFHITPSDTRRESPWGINGSNALSNTQVILANSSVNNQLLSGDIRANYFLIGATWTPFGCQPFTVTNGIPCDPVGTNLMANSALETYTQSLNCFDCHKGNMLGDPGGGTGLSHIFGPIKPLF